MKHSFIDKYSNLDSPLHRLDPRVKLTAAFCSIFIMVSEPPGEIFPFIFYGLIIAALVVISRIPLTYIMRRCLIVSPFIILAALFYPVSSMIILDFDNVGQFNHDIKVGMTIFIKAYLALILLILLTSTEKFHNLLLGLRKLKMPRLLGTISALMYRYIFIIHDELLRTNRARDSRTPGRLKAGRLKVYGNQSAMVFTRSLERSQILYNAMLSRGFKGEFPGMRNLSLTAKDIALLAFFILLLLVIRLTNHPVNCFLFN